MGKAKCWSQRDTDGCRNWTHGWRRRTTCVCSVKSAQSLPSSLYFSSSLLFLFTLCVPRQLTYSTTWRPPSDTYLHISIFFISCVASRCYPVALLCYRSCQVCTCTWSVCFVDLSHFFVYYPSSSSSSQMLFLSPSLSSWLFVSSPDSGRLIIFVEQHCAFVSSD